MALLPLLTGDLFLTVLRPPPLEKEAARSLTQTRFRTRGSTPSSGKEAAPHLLRAYVGTQGFNSFGSLSTQSRSPPERFGREVGCRAFDSGVGAQYPAGGWRTWRKPHRGYPLPLAISSVGQTRGRPRGAGQAHRRIGNTIGTKRLGCSQ